MARINPNEIDKYDTSNSYDWFKLSNHGDTARVQFMYNSPEELDIFACHKVNDGYYDNGNERTRWADCKRDYDSPIDDCPLCAAGIPVKPVMFVSMYDTNDGKVKIWERGKMFKKKLDGLFNRYPNLSEFVFDIERNGQKGDQKTTYEVYPIPNAEAEDISNMERPEFVGGIILDLSPDEMQTYLDTGVLPNRDNANNEHQQEQITRRSRRG